MMDRALTYAPVVLWLLSLVVAAWLAGRQRKRTFEDYTLAGRRMPHWLVAFSLLGTWIGGGTMVALAGAISRTGIVYLLMPVGAALSLVFLGLLAPAYRSAAPNRTDGRFIEQDAPTSLVDRFARQYGEPVRTTMALVVTAIMLAFMAVQLSAGALVLAHITGINALLSTIGFAVLIALYMWIGGARADAYTDLLQVLVVVVAVFAGLIALLVGGNLLPAWNDAVTARPELLHLPADAAFMVPGLLLLPFFSMHTDSGLQQKLLTASSDRDARLASFIAAVVFFVFGLALVALAIVAGKYQTGTDDTDGVLLVFARHALHPGLQAVFYAALLAAVSSTLDSEALLVSTIVVNDILFRWRAFPIGPNGDSGKAAYPLTRLWAVVFFFLAFLLTLVPLTLFSLLSAVWPIFDSCTVAITHNPAKPQGADRGVVVRVVPRRRYHGCAFFLT